MHSRHVVTHNHWSSSLNCDNAHRPKAFSFVVHTKRFWSIHGMTRWHQGSLLRASDRLGCGGRPVPILPLHHGTTKINGKKAATRCLFRGRHGLLFSFHTCAWSGAPPASSPAPLSSSTLLSSHVHVSLAKGAQGPSRFGHFSPHTTDISHSDRTQS